MCCRLVGSRRVSPSAHPRAAMRNGSVCVLFAVGFLVGAGSVCAQTPVAAPPTPSMQMSMPMTPPGPLGIDDTRDGSGTSWLPDESPMSGAMHQAGPWMLMLHGNAFLEDVQTTGARGDHEVGSVNWFMGMAERDIGGGRLILRGMMSLDPLTVGKCGYPDLLQS